MFTKPLDEIAFSDIEDFCCKFPEGERVEYTQKMPTGGRKTKDIPKIVSAFANTSGGILLIGVETDVNNKVIFPIKGILNERGIEERIVQSASEGIYPAVTLEVEPYAVPGENGNIVVIVRVNESQQAPHAIETFTKVHIRVGSTTPLASVDRIEYMLKRREKSKEDSNQILSRIDERVNSRWPSPNPDLTVIARPIFLNRSLISRSEIYEYMKDRARNPRSPILFKADEGDFGTRQVTGGAYGVCFMGAKLGILYWELNEHGTIYHRQELYRSRFESFHGPEDDEENQYLNLDEFVYNICEVIAVAKDFYQKSQYLGNIEITAQLRHVLDERLMFGNERHYESIRQRQSVDAEILAAIECCPRDLIEFEKSANFVVDLVGELVWGFNVSDNTSEDIVRDMIKRWQNQYNAL